MAVMAASSIKYRLRIVLISNIHNKDADRQKRVGPIDPRHVIPKKEASLATTNTNTFVAEPTLRLVVATIQPSLVTSPNQSLTGHVVEVAPTLSASEAVRHATCIDDVDRESPLLIELAGLNGVRVGES